jgi:alpha-tubulin suppressor-like RCC1 family protein
MFTHPSPERPAAGARHQPGSGLAGHRVPSQLARGWPVPAIVAVATALALTPAGPAAASARPAQAATIAPAVLAWGSNFHGELGNGTTNDSNLPVFVQLPLSQRYTVVRSQLDAFAVTASGRLYAWGADLSGELGDGRTTDRLKPVRVRLPAGVKLTAVRAGALFTLALTTTGKVLAWGYNKDGELGNGATGTRHHPVRVHLPRGVKVTAISAGDESGYALTSAGRVLSWGSNAGGELGTGTRKDRHVPGYLKLSRRVTVTSIAAGLGSAYAVTSTGRLLAWGLNGYGQLGDGTTRNRLMPVRVHLPAGTRARVASAGREYALALTRGGAVLAWGDNTDGELGNGSTTSRLTPVRVKLPAGTKVRAMAAGKFSAMVWAGGRRILAWGSNNLGQLGNGTSTDTTVPVRVHLPAGFTPTGIGSGWDSGSPMAAGRAPVA